MAERHGRLTSGAAIAAILKLRSLAHNDGGTGNDVAIIDIALRHGLSGYDASYIALSKSTAMPLATADRRMATVARSEGIAVVGPLEYEH